jgi:hypothetical protein
VLNHLDDIMAVDGIEMIQWVPGQRDLPLAESVELFHRVQKAGKGLHLPSLTSEQVRRLARELRPEGLFFDRVRVASLKEAENLLRWLEANT